MEENKFFKNLKRLNGLIFLGIGLFILYFVVSFIYGQSGGFEPEGKLNEENELVVAPENIAADFGTHLPGHDLYTISLRLVGGSSSGSFSKSYVPHRRINQGVYSAATGTTRWLFESNNQLIFNTMVIEKKELTDTGDSMRVATGHLLTLANLDTNGDGGLSKEDDMSVWTFAPDGSGGTKIIDSVIDDLNFEYLDGEQALIFYKLNDGLFAAQLDTISREITRTNKIESP